ncbi:hypothetical protein A2690_03850 [Candidatus Roizmanbacteria bacterium RIFCSPHIGHO2_01_FULL_39_12b]|uniref:Sortase n=1 Tax=Candidatus Roizmanbacteria bacterium RIFCSPHIGHO2_01_FULL_39_12b TaxID=1802030 RepID=A0A1F7GC76_9BACT|nr:MAG: hypothetical protein A2690_03850 [Candidatus Roizmanbacteria bacterium RIFCSPHIGHO2_01_FULL_39_12b]OGK47074.1 MAG: hypothetical protein A3B46_01575 [Candidatus Roizmanbacteria bacterium RIFCSPLOWO2_01_FULL_39_19]
MTLYRYIKKRVTFKHKLLAGLSYGLIIIGSLFLFWSFYPVISYEIYSYLFIQKKIFSPLPSQTQALSHIKAQSIIKNQNVFSTNLVNYTKAAAWFPSLEKRGNNNNNLFTTKEYTLSIPKLNIEFARVIVGGEDLSEAMVQYQPKILPGEYGVASIFCHSTHPSLYNPNGKNRYKSICTYLPTLGEGDLILVNINNIDYTYEVFGKFEVKPNEVGVLDQKLDDAYLNVITCVPVGQTARRLIVQARLKNIGQE